LVMAFVSQRKFIWCDMDRASAFENIGDFKSALAEYKKIISNEPENYFAMQGAASCLIQLKEYLKAAKLFSRAASIYPAPEFHLNAGIAYHELGLNITSTSLL